MPGIVLGMDPGSKGAVVALTEDEQIAFWMDMPIGPDSFVSVEQLHDQLDALLHTLGYTPADIIASVIEKVRSGGASTGTRGGSRASSMFKFGAAWMACRGAVVGYTRPMSEPTAGVWKKALGHGLGPDKEKSRLYAHQLWPEHRDITFKHKLHEGRAEAALIALWYLRHEWRGRLVLPHGTGNHERVRPRLRIKRG